MENLIEETISKIENCTTEAKVVFSNLSGEQLNRKPAPDKWSIAQCLDHLMVSNSTYYPQFDEIISGEHKNSFYQGIGFISRYFGNYLIRETGPVVNKPIKHPRAFTPSQSNLPDTMVADFEIHQREFMGKIRQLSKVDLDKTILSSPALGIITYSLRDLLIILSGHEQRHIAQAKNVWALVNSR